MMPAFIHMGTPHGFAEMHCGPRQIEVESGATASGLLMVYAGGVKKAGQNLLTGSTV